MANPILWDRLPVCQKQAGKPAPPNYFQGVVTSQGHTTHDENFYSSPDPRHTTLFSEGEIPSMTDIQTLLTPGRDPYLPDQRVEIEPTARWVRVKFGGEFVADSKRVLLVRETGQLPVYFFPCEDVRMDALEATKATVGADGKIYWNVKMGDYIASKGPGATSTHRPNTRPSKTTWPLSGKRWITGTRRRRRRKFLFTPAIPTSGWMPYSVRATCGWSSTG